MPALSNCQSIIAAALQHAQQLHTQYYSHSPTSGCYMMSSLVVAPKVHFQIPDPLVTQQTAPAPAK